MQLFCLGEEPENGIVRVRPMTMVVNDVSSSVFLLHNLALLFTQHLRLASRGQCRCFSSDASCGQAMPFVDYSASAFQQFSNSHERPSSPKTKSNMHNTGMSPLEFQLVTGICQPRRRRQNPHLILLLW